MAIPRVWQKAKKVIIFATIVSLLAFVFSTRSVHDPTNHLQVMNRRISESVDGSDREEMFTYSYKSGRCSNVTVTDDLIHRSLSHLLKDLNHTENNQLTSEAISNGLLNFLPNYRNPCWSEKVEGKSFTYQRSLWNSAWKGTSQRAELRQQQRKMQILINHRIKNGDPRRVRCLPYVYVIGVFKGGTSDFFHSLAIHDHVMRPTISEPRFWTELPRSEQTFSQYLDLFDYRADGISKFSTSGYHPQVTVDASTGTFQGYIYKWLPWRAKSDIECVTLPQHFKYIAPQSHVIILLRHPVDWMTSCYNHFARVHVKHSADDLHARVVDGIKRISACLKETGGDELRCFHRRSQDNPCLLENAMYYVFVKEWRDVLGKDKVLVINSNDYFKDRVSVLSKTYKFLSLRPLSDKNVKQLSSKTHVDNRHAYSRHVKMLSKTSALLQQFLKPWNEKLVKYLGDSSFKWN